MKIILQAIGFKASDALEELIYEKVGKLDHHSHSIIRTNVTLTKGPETELKNNYCEMRVEVPGNDHFVKKNSSSFEHAIAESVDALQHMLERSKEKDKQHAR